MSLRGLRPLHGILAAALFAALPTIATADIMKTCKSEIGNHCSDGRNGNGRIATCRFSHSGSLSGACANDITALSSSRSVARLVPAEVTNLKGTTHETELRAACTSDAAHLCPGVSTADERVLACLYAHDNRLSGSCKTTGKRVISQIR